MANRKIRPIRIDGNVAYITLTKGYEATIDADDVNLVAGWNWHAVVTPCAVYAKRCGFMNGRQSGVSLHRSILDVSASGGAQIDHVDGNGLNNRRCNLRVATRSQNGRNRRTGSNSTSGLKGVSFHKTSRKWRAQIMINKQKLHLGCFETPEEARSAYCQAAMQHHGDFARFE